MSRWSLPASCSAATPCSSWTIALRSRVMSGHSRGITSSVDDAMPMSRSWGSERSADCRVPGVPVGRIGPSRTQVTKSTPSTCSMVMNQPSSEPTSSYSATR